MAGKKKCRGPQVEYVFAGYYRNLCLLRDVNTICNLKQPAAIVINCSTLFYNIFTYCYFFFLCVCSDSWSTVIAFDNHGQIDTHRLSL